MLFLFGSIFLNDFLKLIEHLIERVKVTKKYSNEYRLKQETARNGDTFGVEIQIDKTYSKKLEKRLERVHLNLLKSLSSKHKKTNNNNTIEF